MYNSEVQIGVIHLVIHVKLIWRWFMFKSHIEHIIGELSIENYDLITGSKSQNLWEYFRLRMGEPKARPLLKKSEVRKRECNPLINNTQVALKIVSGRLKKVHHFNNELLIGVGFGME